MVGGEEEHKTRIWFESELGWCGSRKMSLLEALSVNNIWFSFVSQGFHHGGANYEYRYGLIGFSSKFRWRCRLTYKRAPAALSRNASGISNAGRLHLERFLFLSTLLCFLVITFAVRLGQLHDECVSGISSSPHSAHIHIIKCRFRVNLQFASKNLRESIARAFRAFH